jgi:hypothetical protein
MPEKFKDKREREWEWFVDDCYYHRTCVRLCCTGGRDFNSQTSFHFNTTEQALQFVELLKESW